MAAPSRLPDHHHHPRRAVAAEIHRGVLTAAICRHCERVRANLGPDDRLREAIDRAGALNMNCSSLFEDEEKPRLAAGLWWRSWTSLQRVEPVVHVLAGLVLGLAVALLQLAFELFAAALDDVEIIVGEFAPFLPRRALELFPVAFEPVPIHAVSFVDEGSNRSA